MMSLIRRMLEPPTGRVRDVASGHDLPATDDIKGNVSPDIANVPFPAAMSAGVIPVFPLVDFPARYTVHLEKGEETLDGILTEKGYDRLRADLDAQIEQHGRIVHLPDASGLDGFFERE